MKLNSSVLLFSVVLALGTYCGNAAADGKDKKEKHDKKDKNEKHEKKKGPSSYVVPEIDAAGAPLALALMAGCLALLRERRRTVKK